VTTTVIIETFRWWWLWWIQWILNTV